MWLTQSASLCIVRMMDNGAFYDSSGFKSQWINTLLLSLARSVHLTIAQTRVYISIYFLPKRKKNATHHFISFQQKKPCSLRRGWKILRRGSIARVVGLVHLPYFMYPWKELELYIVCVRACWKQRRTIVMIKKFTRGHKYFINLTRN